MIYDDNSELNRVSLRNELLLKLDFFKLKLFDVVFSSRSSLIFEKLLFSRFSRKN